MTMAATLGVLVTCGDATGPVGGTVTLAELVVLPLQAAAPEPQSASFWVSNSTVTVRTVRHDDQFGSLFLELRFPQGSLASLNGDLLTTEDSVRVTVQPRAGTYGFTVSPSGLQFTLSNTPSVTFSYAAYADLSIADAEPAFPDRTAYAAALEVWEEVNIDQWRVARGSSPAGVDEIAAAVDAPGRFLVAARR